MIRRDTTLPLGVVFACALGLILPSVADASHNLLANGDFDTGIATWTPDLLPAGVEVAWDPAVGDPAPGSLRLSAHEFTGGDVVSECFDPPPGTSFRLRSRLLAQASSGAMICKAYISRYSGANCSGSRLVVGGLSPTPLGVWLADEFEAQVTVDRPSFRVALLFESLAGDQLGTCHFDSIELFEPGAASVVEVPATSGPGLGLLVAAFSVAALWLLRRS